MRAKLVHTIVLSMPAGTPPQKMLAAARVIARENFALQHRYALVLHTDQPHPRGIYFAQDRGHLLFYKSTLLPRFLFERDPRSTLESSTVSPLTSPRRSSLSCNPRTVRGKMPPDIPSQQLSAGQKMASILRTTTFKGTWLGKPGVSTTYHFDKKRDGLRVSVLALEGETVKVELIDGDGRFSDGRFKSIRSAVVEPAAVEATVAEFAAAV